MGFDFATLGELEALFGARLGLHLGHFAFPSGSPKAPAALRTATACPAGPPKSRAFYKGIAPRASPKPLVLSVFAIVATVMAARFGRGYAEISGFAAPLRLFKAFRIQPPFQKLPNGCS